MITLEAPRVYGARGNTIALSQALMFGRTRGMSRWHIPRDGRLIDQTRRVYGAWCGATMLRPDDDRNPAQMTDEVGDDVPICGTCVGRAKGAGHELPVVEVTHEAGIVFTPRHIRIPRVCPGAKYIVWHEVNARIGRCYVCGEYDTLSGGYRGYDYTHPHLRNHAPGAGLVDPCPFHAWDHITADGVCSCGHPPIKAVR